MLSVRVCSLAPFNSIMKVEILPKEEATWCHVSELSKCHVWITRHWVWISNWICWTLVTTSNYSALTNSRNPLLTTAHTVFHVFRSRCMVTNPKHCTILLTSLPDGDCQSSPLNCSCTSPALSFLVLGPVGTIWPFFVLSWLLRVLKWGLLFDEKRSLLLALTLARSLSLSMTNLTHH
jgi:hypothetical protein